MVLDKTPPRLPPEILEHIIDLLHASCHYHDEWLSSLSACSLICHGWASYSQKHLFRAVDFVHHTTSHAPDEDRTLTTRVEDYIALLSASVDLGHHLRSIGLYDAQGPAIVYDSYCEKLLPSLLPFLDRITELRLDDLPWQDALKFGLTGRFPSLRSLDIATGYVDFQKSSDVAALIAPLPFLENLRIWATVESSDPYPAAPPPFVQPLTARLQINDLSICDWLVQSRATVSVHVVLDLFRHEDYHYPDTGLPMVGKLTLIDRYNKLEALGALSRIMLPFSNLNAVHLDFRNRLAGAAHACATVCASSAACQLSELSVELSVPDEGLGADKHLLICGDVAETLARRALGSSAAFKMTVHVIDLQHPISEFIQARLDHEVLQRAQSVTLGASVHMTREPCMAFLGQDYVRALDLHRDGQFKREPVE